MGATSQATTGTTAATTAEGGHSAVEEPKKEAKKVQMTDHVSVYNAPEKEKKGFLCCVGGAQKKYKTSAA